MNEEAGICYMFVNLSCLFFLEVSVIKISNARETSQEIMYMQDYKKMSHKIITSNTHNYLLPLFKL